MKNVIAIAALALGMGTAHARSLKPFNHIESANGFGMAGFQELLKEQGQQNIVYSPISAHLALGMLLNGADGSTLKELSSTLRIPTGHIQASNASVLKLLKELNSRPKGELVLSLNNGLWAKPGINIKSAYLGVMKSDYQAEVGSLSSAAMINDWAAAKTNNLITKVIEDISGLEMVLANATYFKADWSQPFETAQNGVFTTADGKKVQKDIMFQKTHARYVSSDNYEAVELQYGPSALASMIVVLPKAGQNLQNFSQKINATWYNDVVDELLAQESGKGLIRLPKFDFKTEWKMNDALQNLGMRTAFAGGADFSKMTDARLLVSYVKQDAVIKVHEKGTEAAAVTSIGMEATSIDMTPPFHFTADRPFYYFIRDNGTGVILFAGQVVN